MSVLEGLAEEAILLTLKMSIKYIDITASGGQMCYNSKNELIPIC